MGEKNEIHDPYTIHYSSDGYIEIMDHKIYIPYIFVEKFAFFKEQLCPAFLSRNKLLMFIPDILNPFVLDENTVNQLCNCLFDLIDYKIRISPENKDLLNDVKQAINEFSLNTIEQKAMAKSSEVLEMQSIVNTLPSFPKEKLGAIFFADAIEAFLKIEDRIINDGYFNSDGQWTKPLDECAAFIQKLFANKYLLPKKKGIWITKVCKPFFEDRYKVRFTKQMQPRYRQDNKLSSYFTWIDRFK